MPVTLAAVVVTLTSAVAGGTFCLGALLGLALIGA